MKRGGRLILELEALDDERFARHYLMIYSKCMREMIDYENMPAVEAIKKAKEIHREVFSDYDIGLQ